MVHTSDLRASNLHHGWLYRFDNGNRVIRNVLSLEGTVAVATPEDYWRFGSHCFDSRVSKPGIASSHFLLFHLMTEEGFRLLGDASSGSTGRNRI